MISYYHYQTKRRVDRYTGDFDEFLRSPRFGTEAYNRHVASWFPEADFVLAYEHLMKGGAVLFGRLFQSLGLDVPNKIIQEAVSRSSPERMRAIENARSRPNHASNFDTSFVFVRNGRPNQWQDALSEEQATYIWESSNNILKVMYEKNAVA